MATINDTAKSAREKLSSIGRRLQAEHKAAGEKVKSYLALTILIGSGLFMLITWVIYAYLPSANYVACVGAAKSTASQCEMLFESEKAAAGQIFEFAKTWLPPTITLVVGYYFTRQET